MEVTDQSLVVWEMGCLCGYPDPCLHHLLLAFYCIKFLIISNVLTLFRQSVTQSELVCILREKNFSL